MTDGNNPPTLFVIGAHLDDAVLSCGGTLSSLGRAGWRLIVATVFTEAAPVDEPWELDRFNLAGGDSLLSGLAKRRAEDREAGRRLGYLPIHLGFTDASFRAPYRRSERGIAAFADRAEAAGDVLAPLIAARLESTAAAARPDLVFAPMSIGDHVDHLVVNSASRTAFSGSRPQALWYEDLPYGWSTTPEVAMTVAPQYFDEVDLERKLAAIAAFESQLDYLDETGNWRDRMTHHARSIAASRLAERMWSPAAVP